MKICIYCDEFQHDKDMFDRDTCLLCAEEFGNKEAQEEMDRADELKYMEGMDNETVD